MGKNVNIQMHERIVFITTLCFTVKCCVQVHLCIIGCVAGTFGEIRPEENTVFEYFLTKYVHFYC